MDMVTLKSVLEPLFGWMPDWLVAVCGFAVILFLALVLQDVLVRVIGRWLLPRLAPLVQSTFLRARGVIRFAFLLLALAIALPLVPMGPHTQETGHRILVAALIVLIGWIAILAVNVGAERYVSRFRMDVADNLLARKAQTQIRVLRHATNVLLAILTAACALMTFDTVRQFGVSLFASAGIAGIAVGFAARPVLSNLIAGVQLALTQPIRLGDVVVIEGEWGKVEELTATYVVIAIWDWRRLIVPLSYFMEKPFANWTRSSSAIIGSVFLYVDYTVPVEKVRRKAIEFAHQSKSWDRQVINLQVTDAKERTLELRVLATAADSGTAWNLRCELREKLIAYIQSEFPEALPRYRAEFEAQAPPVAAHKRGADLPA
jgi:small-conductance mechanosensitive channel